MLLLNLISILFALVSTFPTSSWIPFSTLQYTNSINLTSGNGKNISLFWKYNEYSIEFGVASYNGPTWVGIGISETGGMKGADIVVGRGNGDDYQVYLTNLVIFLS